MPNYSEYVRERVERHNSLPSVSRTYAIEDFVRQENIENVRKLEQLAGDIRSAAQPQEPPIEANLTLVFERTNDALGIVYGKPTGLSPDECQFFISLFREFGIEVT